MPVAEGGGDKQKITMDVPSSSPAALHRSPGIGGGGERMFGSSLRHLASRRISACVIRRGDMNGGGGTEMRRKCDRQSVRVGQP